MSRVNGLERYMEHIAETKYKEGIIHGVGLMEQRIIAACESGNPVEVKGKAYFIKSDIQNLRDVFNDLGKEEG